MRAQRGRAGSGHEHHRLDHPGAVGRAIAKFLLPGRDPGGFIRTTLIGIAGAFIGGWISARWLDHPVTKSFYDGPTWAAAIGGSLVLLIAYRLLFGNSRD